MELLLWRWSTGFSVGYSYLPVHGEPASALPAGDEAMYEQKSKTHRRIPSEA